MLVGEGGYEPMNRLLLAFNVTGGDCDDVMCYAFEDMDVAYSFEKEIKKLLGEELKESPSAFILRVIKGYLPMRNLRVKENYGVGSRDVYHLLSKG